MKTGGEVSLKL